MSFLLGSRKKSSFQQLHMRPKSQKKFQHLSDLYVIRIYIFTRIFSRPHLIYLVLVNGIILSLAPWANL